MKVEVHEQTVRLRAEDADELSLLNAFWDRGVYCHSGGSFTSIGLPYPHIQFNLTEEEVYALMYALGRIIEADKSGLGRELPRGVTPMQILLDSILVKAMESIHYHSEGDWIPPQRPIAQRAVAAKPVPSKDEEG